MRLSFHGGAREVTGACFLLETNGVKILVDCGLFQGCSECEDLNFETFKFDPRKIDAVLVTHAHLDHIGRIPKLVKDGFSGKIYSTPPTRDLAALILEDALSLAGRDNRALYGAEDLEKTFQLWKEAPYHKKITVGDMVISLADAGHILGSSFVEILVRPVRSHPDSNRDAVPPSAERTSNGARGKRFLFTGDLGNIPSPLLPPPETFRGIEYLIIESTYGSRTHEGEKERVLMLERAVEDAASRGGVLIIPAFATERTQDILYLLNEMLLFKRIPEMPVFVDAPLAIRATAVFEKYPEYYREEIRELFREHPNLFRFKRLKFTKTTDESKAINGVPPPKVILAGSGMMQGGRILHHLRRYLPDPKSILLVTGYQAAGSLGRRLLDGAGSVNPALFRKGGVKIFGEEISVRAEIRKISGFSAHADNPQLFEFVSSNRDGLKRVFVVQGEEAEALHFMQEIKDRLGIEAVAPMLYDEYVI